MTDTRCWVGRYDCGCVVAIDTGGPDDMADDPCLTVSESTLAEALDLLAGARHSKPACVLADAIDRVRDLHRADTDRLDADGRCAACDRPHPCPTLHALEAS